jgi:fumarate hydratase, class II
MAPTGAEFCLCAFDYVQGRSAMADPNHNHPMIRDIPIGLSARGSRSEFDSMGNVDVPADRYWGAQTQRLLR